jgi:hypothetical protein
MEPIVHTHAGRQIAAIAVDVTGDRDDVLRAVQRLEKLYAEINALNDVLQEMLDSDSSIALPRKPMSRRRLTATMALALFRQQAKKLTVYAPY